MALDREKLLAEIAALLNADWQDCLKLLLFESIPSTNQALWEAITQGQTLPIAAISVQQTAGRGQWGRSWQSERGGLYLSLALDLNLTAQAATQVTLWSAWGIAHLLRQYNIPVGLKWPNDLVLEGRKLGGIKCETKMSQNHLSQVVIGVGINWENPVPDTGIQLGPYLSSLSSPSPSISHLEQLAAIVLQGLYLGFQRYAQVGITSIVQGYLDYFVNLNQSIVLDGSPGKIIGITDQGELRVKLQSPGASTEITVQPGMIRLGYEQANSTFPRLY
ncbi:MAG: biotin--[acetyl-CoA-carboxylase] ligase [Snowella sp.]|nr:biotin--[acetyl-CoA-carboxylase] ligase [Snowella sp.]